MISCLDSYCQGIGKIPFGWDFLFLDFLSLSSLYLAVSLRMSDKHAGDTLTHFKENVNIGISITASDKKNDSVLHTNPITC